MINHRIEGKKTFAYVTGCKYDAVRVIAKRMPMIKKAFPRNKDLFENIETVDTFGLKHAVIKDSWEVCVEPHKGDMYGKQVGINEADKKLINRLEIAMNKAIKRWQEHMLVDMARCGVKTTAYRGIDHFNAERMRDAIVKEIQELAKKQGFRKVVIGISGGKDSTVCAALLARALGSNAVYGVLLPDGDQSDISDSYEVVKALGIKYKECNINDIHNQILLDVSSVSKNDTFRTVVSNESDINVGPRIRMTVLRAISQSLHARLCGTGNLSESFVGYCTKDGDTSCDFNPIGMLTSKEVVAIGLTMDEIPRHLVEKVPVDGLSGMSDEEKLGVSYDDIHTFIRSNDKMAPEVLGRIDKLHRISEHKRNVPHKLLEDNYRELKTKYWDYI